MAGKTLGVILAGGRSSRFGADKALALLDGKPLAALVAERLAPQVDCVALNANGAASIYSALAIPVFGDRTEQRDGPLAGIVASLSYAHANGFDDVITAPCDAPALRGDLVSRLRGARGAASADCAFVEINGVINPVFGLYRVALESEIAQIFSNGSRAPRDLAGTLRAAVAKFEPHEAAGFRDIDTQDDLAAFQSIFLPAR